MHILYKLLGSSNKDHLNLICYGPYCRHLQFLKHENYSRISAHALLTLQTLYLR